MRRIDGWELIARIAAQRERFSASGSIAETTAFLIVRNQLMLGVRTVEDFRAVGEAIGKEAMASVIRSLASYELRRILENLKPEAAGQHTAEEARRLLARLLPSSAPVRGAEELLAANEPILPPTQTLRRHRALGARRVREPATS